MALRKQVLREARATSIFRGVRETNLLARTRAFHTASVALNMIVVKQTRPDNQSIAATIGNTIWPFTATGSRTITPFDKVNAHGRPAIVMKDFPKPLGSLEVLGNAGLEAPPGLPVRAQ